MKIAIENREDMNSRNEILEFLDDLPYRLKLKTIMYIFKDAYEQIDFLNSGSENFLAWICPLLQQQYLASDQIIYYESDIISEIYFLLNGLAGFVIPYHRNVVYIEIEKGDRFGDIDFIASAK